MLSSLSLPWSTHTGRVNDQNYANGNGYLTQTLMLIRFFLVIIFLIYTNVKDIVKKLIATDNNYRSSGNQINKEIFQSRQ